MVWICDDIQTPFILGVISPRIYIPSGTDEAKLPHIIAHENAHLKRRDHWWKPLGFVILAIHWFNPLVWVAYILLCRDIELACDEKVIRELNQSESISYSEALLSCSVNRRMILVCPLAFGEVGVKERVKHVLNYKKPAFRIVVVAVIACVVVAVCFLTNPVTSVRNATTKWFDYLENPEEMNWDGRMEANIPKFPDVTFCWYPETMEAVTDNKITPLYTGMPIWNTYFCDLTGDGLPELCSTISWGSGIIDNRVIIYDYAGRAAIADLDKFGIRYWAEPRTDSLDAAISSAILAHYASDEPDGLIQVESHVLLANEGVNRTPLAGTDDHAKKVTAYLLVHHVKYSTYGGALEAVGGSYVPTAITFKITDSGEYILEEYWKPRDGNYYVKDIRNKFPGAAADDALNHQELFGYGEYTLRYCFTEFLNGGQTDLRGQIMALACRDIMLAWGEGYAIDPNPVTGQDWFKHFRSNAEALSLQYGNEDLAKLYPGSYLLLRMSDSSFMTNN